MKVVTLGFTLALSLLLAGCGGLQKFTDSNARAVGAEPLEVSETEMKDPGDKKEFLGRVILDSEKKCDSFMRRLTVAQSAVNATGDILATLFSATATVLTPINTIHALTAAATVTTATKSTINADIYAKASIVNFQTALSKTYYRYIKEYAEQLTTVDEGALVVSVEVSKIQMIHSTCTLSAAETTINSQLGQDSGTGNGDDSNGDTKAAIPGARIPTPEQK